MKFDISTIIWLFFIIAALQPLLKKRLLVAMRLYPQPVKHKPSVEYIPLPRFKGPAHKS
jgi:hypothetical protein